MTMDEKNIMIGDWVRLAENYKSLINLNIKVDIGELVEIIGGYKLVQPIPLTMEILKDNGFLIEENGKLAKFIIDTNNTTVTNITILQRNNGNMSLLLRDYTCYAKVEMDLQYVHELQHALRLLNIDKQIEL